MIRRFWVWLFPPEEEILLVDIYRRVLAADPQVSKPRPR
jgi:hypothetical protein